MTYAALNENNIADYCRNVPALNAQLGEGELAVQEIGDGNINYVFIVKNQQQPQRALVIKQAVPYMRCIGESYALSRERMNYETAALQTFRDFTPAYIPEIFHADSNMSLVAMRYLNDHVTLRKGLIAGQTYPLFAEQISSFLAEVLFKTSSLHLNGVEKRQAMQRFNNNAELCQITENFVFSYAFMAHETNQTFPGMEAQAALLRQDSEFKINAMTLKYKFMNQTDALLHGDLHTGSIMINQQEMLVIDPEFAFFGPFGFDVGAIIANFILSYVSHKAQNAAQDYLDWLKSTTAEILNLFSKKFLQLWHAQTESALLVKDYFTASEQTSYQQKMMQSIFQDTAGYAGCKMVRRILGIAGVADIREIQNPQQRRQAETHALAIGKNLVKNYLHCTSADTLLNLIATSYE